MKTKTISSGISHYEIFHGKDNAQISFSTNDWDRGTDSLVTIQASKYYGDGILRIKKYARI